MTSTRNNPRIAQSGVALTSLGAVGGARGTAAGGLRVLVEFLTTYDKGNIDQLKDDIRQLEHNQTIADAATQKRDTEISRNRQKLAESERVIRGKLNTQLRTDLKQIEVLESSRSRANRATAVSERAIFNAAAQSRGVTATELALLEKRSVLAARTELLEKRNATAQHATVQRTQQLVQVEGQLSKIQQVRASLAPRLTGLAVGALGGIVGGAVLGLGFAAAQDALAKVGDVIQDIIDPARHSREAIRDLGAEIAKLANDKALSFLDAAKLKLKELGHAGDDASANLLAQFAAQAKVTAGIDEYIKFIEAGRHPQSAQIDDVKKLTDTLIEEAKIRGDLKVIQVASDQSLTDFSGTQNEAIDRQYYMNQALIEYERLLAEATAAAEAMARAQREQADAAALAAAKQEALNSALQAISAANSTRIDARIEGLGTGESARTRSIQTAIDRLSSGSGNGLGAQLKNIGDERQLILLRQRLKLLGSNIDLEKYSGKFLLEAIDAKIAALEKEGAAQDRINAALDLQFRMSKQIKRQAGESIADFVERRAQEQRAQLAEQDKLARDAKIASLNELKNKVQDEVALAQNAEQRKTALASAGASARAKLLQKELADSKKHDAAVLAAKKKALEAEKKAYEEKVAEAIKLSSDQATGEALAAIAGAKSVEDIAFLSGKIAGLRRAKGTIEALVAGFLIPDFIAKPFLANINKQLAAYSQKQGQIDPDFSSRSHPRAFAKGGFIELKNSRSPFGSNIKTGEEGTELGYIMSRRMSEAFKDQMGPQQIGPFNVYGDGPMNTRFQYQLKRTVKEAVAEAVNR